MRSTTMIRIMPVQVTILIKTIAIMRMTLQQKLLISENKVVFWKKMSQKFDLTFFATKIYLLMILRPQEILAKGRSIFYDRFRKIVPITENLVVA